LEEGREVSPKNRVEMVMPFIVRIFSWGFRSTGHCSRNEKTLLGSTERFAYCVICWFPGIRFSVRSKEQKSLSVFELSTKCIITVHFSGRIA
jgi:hypothetical protein